MNGATQHTMGTGKLYWKVTVSFSEKSLERKNDFRQFPRLSICALSFNKRNKCFSFLLTQFSNPKQKRLYDLYLSFADQEYDHTVQGLPQGAMKVIRSVFEELASPKFCTDSFYPRS